MLIPAKTSVYILKEEGVYYHTLEHQYIICVLAYTLKYFRLGWQRLRENVSAGGSLRQWVIKYKRITNKSAGNPGENSRLATMWNWRPGGVLSEWYRHIDWDAGLMRGSKG